MKLPREFVFMRTLTVRNGPCQVLLASRAGDGVDWLFPARREHALALDAFSFVFILVFFLVFFLWSPLSKSQSG